MRISIFGPDDTTDELASKVSVSEHLPSASLCEEDVSYGSHYKTWRFLKTYITGHNERIRFVVLQKQCWSRWGPILLIYNFLDSISSILHIHNLISSLLILIALSITKSTNILYAFMCYTMAWIGSNVFTFDKEVLPSFFFLGYSVLESPQVGEVTDLISLHPLHHHNQELLLTFLIFTISLSQSVRLILTHMIRLSATQLYIVSSSHDHDYFFTSSSNNSLNFRLHPFGLFLCFFLLLSHLLIQHLFI